MWPPSIAQAVVFIRGRIVHKYNGCFEVVLVDFKSDFGRDILNPGFDHDGRWIQPSLEAAIDGRVVGKTVQGLYEKKQVAVSKSHVSIMIVKAE